MNELLRIIFNLPEQASTVALEIDVLHYVVILASIAGAFGVATAIAVFSSRERGAAHRDGAPAQQTPRGVAWRLELAAILALLAFFLALWLVGFRQFLRLSTPPAKTLDVYVIGKQWMWAFAYPDGTASNADLVVPVGRPVKLLLTSRDVIHSFYVPSFRVKQDAVPGRMTITWFEATKPGTYDILCTEYCGLAHSTMRGRVIVLPPAAYDAWLRERWADEGDRVSQWEPLLGNSPPRPRANLAVIGERVASERGCLRCHTLDGTPHLGPSFAGLYMSKVELSDRSAILADDAYLTESMMDPQARLHRGYGAIMPSYLGLLSAAEVAALVEMIHSLKRTSVADREPPAIDPDGLLPLEGAQKAAGAGSAIAPGDGGSTLPSLRPPSEATEVRP